METRREVCIEELLQWAYRDELSKRQTSSAEGIWDRILEEGRLGLPRDPGHGAAQRYSHFGLPDPDAERIEVAVSALEDTVIDWRQSFPAIAAELSALVSINEVDPRPMERKKPKASWGDAGDKALRAWWGERGAQPIFDRPRDVLMVGGLRTSALVTMHAVKGTRPEWMEESPKPEAILAERGPGVQVVGECRGKNLYTIGSHCPLRWEPSPLSIVTARAEYVAWHHGLEQLAQSLKLDKFSALPPKAPRLPWLEGAQPQERIIPGVVVPRDALPLAPARGYPAPQRRRPKAGPVRRLLAAEIG